MSDSNPKILKNIFGIKRLQFNCPGCNLQLTADIADIGSKSNCPSCSAAFTTPGATELTELRKAEEENASARKVLAIKRKQEKAAVRELNRAKAESKRLEKIAPADSAEGTATAPENSIVGKILESRYKKAGPVAKGLSAISFLFLFVYYLVAIALCFTCIGIIIAIFMMSGVMAFQAALLYVMSDGWVYAVECPLCNRRIERLFLPDGKSELSQPCPSCKKLLIVRKDLVFHVP